MFLGLQNTFEFKHEADEDNVDTVVVKDETVELIDLCDVTIEVNWAFSNLISDAMSAYAIPAAATPGTALTSICWNTNAMNTFVKKDDIVIYQRSSKSSKSLSSFPI